MNHLIAVLTVIAAYLIGSINFAVIFTKKYNNVDVRDFGSGNAGTTNVLRVSGAKAGAATFALDILKGVVAAGIGWIVFDLLLFNPELALYNSIYNPVYGKLLCGFACMIGHCFPVFFGFRGGKAVATSVGIFAVCCPVAIMLGLLVFAISLAVSRIVSLSSIIATFVVVGVTIFWSYASLFSYEVRPIFVSLIVIACGLIVVLRHKDNIVRIVKGTEKKFTIKKESK